MKQTRKSKYKKNNTPSKHENETSVFEGLTTGTRRWIVAIVFAALSVVFVLAVLGMAGVFGSWLVKLFVTIFGILGYLSPIAFLCAAYVVASGEKKQAEEFSTSTTKRVVLGVVISWVAASGLLHVIFTFGSESVWSVASSGGGGGYVGALAAFVFLGLLGSWAAMFILTALLVVGFMVAANWSPSWPIKSVTLPTENDAAVSNLPKADFASAKLESNEKPSRQEVRPAPAVAPKIQIPKPAAAPTMDITSSRLPQEEWQLPSFDLLEKKTSNMDGGNIEANAVLIQQTLKNFGIEVEMGEVSVGPTVTQYTLRPATGVKLSQIAALKQDLALALAAKSLRMELPIPGKALVGVEVPNKTAALVTLRSVLETQEFVGHKGDLVIALGLDVAGKAQYIDIAKLPHMLIAGSTNSGKSVAINTLIISLLYRASPRMIKFILIDPKRVELTLYQGLPHLLTPPITEPDKAVNALRWCVSEMERRFQEVSKMKRRNISEYNAVAPEPMPYIVIIIDEMADLMATASSEMEATISRLTQMARAVGIHLILATQRPSVNILTGVIKSNITARMAFKLPSQIDSRTILDGSGAEQLVGNGDMLFVSAEQAKPRRMQGAFVGESEVRKVVEFCKRQVGAVLYNDSVVEKSNVGLGGKTGSSMSEEDDLFEDAKQEVMQSGKASASFLQRRLRVGYSRAARLIDLLEAAGVVGPADGARPREVYGVAASAEQDAGEADFDQTGHFTEPVHQEISHEEVQADLPTEPDTQDEF